MGAVDELVQRWRANPDADATLALCSFLSSDPGREDLIREVGTSAQTWHLEDVDVMLAVGRMYLDAQLLAEAQAGLVAAGKANPRDGRPFRFLGEVLLRRGDAVRADKVLTRAMQLGHDDSDTRLWHERAQVYVALQKRVGQQAVAAEVTRTLPKKNSVRPPPAGSVPDLGRPSFSDEITQPRAQQPAGLGAPPLAPPAAAPRGPTPLARAPAAAPIPQQVPTFDDPTRVMDKPPSFRPPPAPTLDDPQLQASAPAVPAPAPAAIPGLTPLGPGAGLTGGNADAVPASTKPKSVPPPLPPLRGEPEKPKSTPPPLPPLAEPVQGVPAEAPPAQEAAALPEPALAAGSSLPAGTPPVPGDASITVEIDDRPQVEAQQLLEHLAKVGVYEPEGGAAPAWVKAPKEKSKGLWIVVVVAFLFGVGGGGAYAYLEKVRQEEYQRAETLTAEVESMLASSDLGKLKETDSKLNQVFELNSRNPEAALLWLENRVLNALLTPGETPGIDSAMHRARQLEIPEEKLAFGRIASFQAEGDLAGAAQRLTTWDKKAAKDAKYQLAAGAVLEQAGDLRAIERYQLAHKLAPDYLPAHVLLAQAVLVELGPEKGKPIAEKAIAKLGDEHPNAKALRALLWALQGGDALPANATLSDAERGQVAAPLRSAIYVTDALVAQDKGDQKALEEAVTNATKASRTPAMATWVGFIAIQSGNEQLSRKAALKAVKLSAVYPRARVLAARVALLGGRLQEAQKAIEKLDPTSGEVAVVRAVVAYETFDTSELSAAIEALGEDAAKSPQYGALAAASDLVKGTAKPRELEELQKWAKPEVPWGELLAVDAALDAGDLESAKKLTEGWAEARTGAVYALRLGRLARYEGDAKAALQASAAARRSVTVPVLLELVYELLAAEQAKDARTVVAKYPTLLGPMTAWLKVLIDAESGKDAEAAAKIGTLEEPPPATPLALKVLVARALAATGDRRGKGYVGTLMQSNGKHPDVVLAAKALGLAR